MRVVDAALSSAADGVGQTIVVQGASGIGKSALCAEASANAQLLGFRVAWGWCWPEPGAPQLWPWQEIVGSLAAPDFSSSSPSEFRAHPLADHPASDGERFTQISQAVASVRSVLRTDQPSLIVVEDLHDADPTAVLLARLIARTCAELPVLLIATWRNDVQPRYPDLAPLLGALAQESTTIELGGLEPPDIASLASLRGRDDLGERDFARLHELSGGNPLLMHALLDRPGPHGVTMPVPARSLLDQHLDQLEPATLALLTDLAVFGHATEGELARLTQHPFVHVHPLLAPAERIGVVTRAGDGTLRLAHELYRARILERTPPGTVIDSHRRSADLLRHEHRGRTGLTTAVAIAEHAFAAADLSDHHRIQAMSDCSAAATALSRQDAFEQAAELWDKAVQLSESGAGGASAALRIQHAEAVMRCGRLIEARQLFEDAIPVSQEQGDVVQAAVAALRLGGMWVNERRQPADRLRTLATQRRCLGLLPDQDSALALRLRARLAAEAVYEGEPVAELAAIVDRIRNTNDTRALMEALSMYHHCLLGPDHHDVRLPVAEELLRHATADGDGPMVLMALCWRAVDLLTVGSPRALAAADQLRIRAEAVHSEHVLFIVRCHETMSMLLQGDLAAAEASANETFALGNRVGDADSLAYYGGHLFAIRFLQDRCHDLVPLIDAIAGSANLAEFDRSFVAGIALAASGAGDLETAGSALDILVGEGLASLPRMSTWLATMLGVCFAGSRLGRPSVLEEAYALLLPYRHLPVRPSLAVVCFGSVEWPLGLAADGMGRIDDAITHFSRAVTANEKLANRPVTAIALGSLADALARRGRPDDLIAAAGFFDRAARIGDECEMAARGATWRTRSDQLARASAATMPQDVAAGSSGVLTVKVVGAVAEFRLGSASAAVPFTIGVGYLQQLIAQPATDIAVELLAGIRGASEDTESRQQIADQPALAAYRRRALELRAAIESADAANDIERAALERLELDRLLDHLDAVVNDRGVSRSFADVIERTRISAQKAIRRTITGIAALDPTIGAHLDRSVRTGRYCRYDTAVGEVR